MLTQIYEVSTADEARAISAIGVDHIGILVGDGQFPREQSLAAAREIAAAIAPPSRFIALFLSDDIGFIVEWARRLDPAIVHLGAAPDRLMAEDVAEFQQQAFGCQIMRSIPIVGEQSIGLAMGYRGIADYLLLDSYRAEDRQIGALGVTHDWTISRRIVEQVRVPVILAGGLGPDNVADAIRAVQPAGVDSKTKTDRDGSHAKDIAKVAGFHVAARTAIVL